MRVLFLDDDLSRRKKFRSARPSAKIVKTAKEAITALSEEEFDMVFLDHDLSGEVYVDSERTDTGMEVVRWIEQNKPICGKIVVHTCNPDAGVNMAAKLVALGYEVQETPFPRLKLDSIFIQEKDENLG